MNTIVGSWNPLVENLNLKVSFQHKDFLALQESVCLPKTRNFQSSKVSLSSRSQWTSARHVVGESADVTEYATPCWSILLLEVLCMSFKLEECCQRMPHTTFFAGCCIVVGKHLTGLTYGMTFYPFYWKRLRIAHFWSGLKMGLFLFSCIPRRFLFHSTYVLIWAEREYACSEHITHIHLLLYP